MCFRKKVKTAGAVKEDREKISSNSKFIESVIARCHDEHEYVKRLKNLQEKLKYLIPSQKTEVFEYEKAIEKKIVDLNRVVMSYNDNLVKGDVEFNRDINNLIIDIYALIADRNTIL